MIVTPRIVARLAAIEEALWRIKEKIWAEDPPEASAAEAAATETPPETPPPTTT